MAPLLLPLTTLSLLSGSCVRPCAWRHGVPPACCAPSPPPPRPPARQRLQGGGGGPPSVGLRRGYGGGGEEGGVLRPLEPNFLHALAAVWTIQRRGDRPSTLRRMASWGERDRGLLPALLQARSMGAYFDESLEAVVMLRYERDLSSLQRAVEARHMLVIEGVAIAPSVPYHVQPELEAWILRSLLQLGALHSMRVTFARSFGEDPPWGV